MQFFTRSIKLAIVCILLAVVNIKAQTPSLTLAKTFGGTDRDYGSAIAEDAVGNIYITGEFTGTVNFGNSVTLTSQGNVDFYVVKFDHDGKALWGRSGGGILTDRGYGVAIDDAGNVIVTGHYYGSSTFESKTVVSSGNLDAFTAKYDSAGNLIWLKEGKGTSQVSTRGIAVDKDDNYYIVGYFGTSGKLTVEFDTLTLTSNGQRDIFLVKYDSAGAVKWGVNAGSAVSGEEAKDVTVDDAGNIYMTGMFVDTAYFGSNIVIGDGGSDIFIAKYNPDGKLVWVKSAGSHGDDIGYGITADNAGHIYLSGRFDSTATFGTNDYTTHGDYDAFIAKLDTAGNFIWVDNFGGTGADVCGAVKTDAAGYCIGYGSFNDAIDIGSTNFVSSGLDDIFFVKLDPDGSVIWAKAAGGSDKDAANSLVIESNGNVVSTGYFNLNFSFDGQNFTSVGKQDILLCRLGSTVLPVELLSFKSSISNGNVRLAWSTATETNNLGFAIERSTDKKTYNVVGFVKGNGTSTNKNNYSFTDAVVSSSKCYYRLKQIDFDGTFSYSSEIEVDLNQPVQFEVYQNYPNPFNPTTSIAFDLPIASKVTIVVYNSIGKQVSVIANKEYSAGRNEVKFDASSLSSGVYIYKLNAISKTGSVLSSIKKMILIR